MKYALLFCSLYLIYYRANLTMFAPCHFEKTLSKPCNICAVNDQRLSNFLHHNFFQICFKISETFVEGLVLGFLCRQLGRRFANVFGHGFQLVSEKG